MEILTPRADHTGRTAVTRITKAVVKTTGKTRLIRPTDRYTYGLQEKEYKKILC